MSVETNRVRLGLNGNYAANVGLDINGSGELILSDTVAGSKLLSELIGNVGSHSISSHTDMGSDFATQYYNSGRLATYIADATKGNTVGISGDVGGHTSLGGHVADAAIHQRVPKFVLRVAKGGQAYSTIGAALAAIPTSGGDAPGPNQWWRVEVAPGVYNEALTIDKQWVELVGAGRELTRIEYDNAATPGVYPLYVAANFVIVRDITVKSTNPAVGQNIAALVGAIAPGTGLNDVIFRACHIESSGTKALWNSVNSSASIFQDCTIRSGSGVSVQQVGGGARYSYCRFNPGSLAASLFCDYSGLVYLEFCQGLGNLVEGDWDSVIVRCSSGSGLASGSGVVRWDGLGFSFNNTSSGPLTVIRDRTGAAEFYDSIFVRWLDTDGPMSQQHLEAGHDGVAIGVDPTWGVAYPDFHWFRSVQGFGVDIAGDVYAIGDDSEGDSNTTNALALYLGANNTGKFLRWIDGDLGGSELGYIGRDGVINAPGFVGDGSGLTALPAHTHSISDVIDLRDELDSLQVGKQDSDGDLTALAGLSSTGLIARTGSNTAAVRTLTGTASEITVTNGNGVSGNPTISAHSNLARLATVQTWTAQQNFSRISAGAMVTGHREITGTDSILASDYTLGINVGANITLTLPSAASVEIGTTFEIYNLQTGGGYNTTINTASGSEYLVWDTNVLTSFTFPRSKTGTLLIKKYFTGAWAVIRNYS